MLHAIVLHLSAVLAFLSVEAVLVAVFLTDKFLPFLRVRLVVAQLLNLRSV